MVGRRVPSTACLEPAVVSGEALTKSGALAPGLALPALVFVLAFATTGCGARLDPDQPLPGSRCDVGGICWPTVRDVRLGPFPLTLGCSATADRGLAPQQVALFEDGDALLAAGFMTSTADGTPLAGATSDAAVVTMKLGQPGTCPSILAVEQATGGEVHGAAHSLTGDGRFVAFAGPVAVTTKVLRHEGGSEWTASAVDRSRPPPDPGPAAHWRRPNALVASLPYRRALVARTAEIDAGDLSPTDPVLALELFDMSGEVPVLLWESILDAVTVPEITVTTGWPVPVRILAQPTTDAGVDRIVLMGPPGQPLSLIEGTLKRVDEARPGVDPNRGAAVVMLPLRPGTSYEPGSALFIGGGSESAEAAPGPDDFRRMHLYNPLGLSWDEVGLLPRPRVHQAAVLLPDGRIAVVGGSADDRRTLYIDPARDFEVRLGESPLSSARRFGVNALVTRDGSVAVLGGRTSAPDAAQKIPPDMEIVEPSYRDPSLARPFIVAAPDTAISDTPFTVQLASEAGTVSADELVLLAFAATVGTTDSSQRLVQLDFQPGAAPGELTVLAPPAAWAPAGRYLLFALRERIPSEGVALELRNE
jgi:hypothetical protein